MYKISFYTPQNKVPPIKKFLDSCQPSLRSKILRQLKYVEEYGLSPAIPNIRKVIGAPLWELRILGRDNIRIICTSLLGKEVKVLHIFKKKKQKIPTKEINIALRRTQKRTQRIT
ncbi:type II toxin-antitoxin system RelE/ParE family toxin [Candidatus Microgenomates bacterium]|nr:type II toxin-antitoxin system RelE/ParE family toxin [Candidatus Microgenomates bacterium]